MSGGPGGRARLFVALTLEAEVCERLAGWAREMVAADGVGGEPGGGKPGGRESGEGKPGVRLLDAEALHLTLCFLGGVSLSAVDGISTAISDVVGVAVGAAGGPLVFEPETVRWLPPGRPRVCAVSLRDRGGRAAGLQAALSARLAAGGWYAPERREWLAHVTVARVSRGARAARAGDPPPPAMEPFGAAGIALMRSWPGSRYEALARVAL